MAGAKFEYDEKGTTFYYFLVSFFGLVLIPLTYYAWTNTKVPGKKKITKACRCPPCQEKREILVKRQPKTKTIRYVSLAVVTVLWAMFFAGVYQVAQFERDFSEYDPYAILELDEGATMAQIRRQFRRLSMIYHPDKDTGDPIKFMKIAKAHAALTNEESRKNWEEHGNPDGPGATNFGIALPSWLVSKENSMWVLGAYGLAFMVILPVSVGTWWYKSIQYSCDQILLDTTQLYFHFFHKTPSMQTKRVLMILASSMEFEKGHNNEIQERPSDNEVLPELMRDLPNLSDKNKEVPLCYPYSLKARTLIHAHLSRMELPQDTLKLDLNLILNKSPYLLQEMVSCISQLILMARTGRAANMPRLETIENCIRVSQMITQGLWDNKSSLLQLPHLTADCMRHFMTKKRNIRSIKQLVSMKEEDRRSLLRSFSDDQYQDIITVCSSYPVVEMTAKAHVLDDEEDGGLVTAGSIVTVTVHMKRRNLGDFFEEESPEAQLLESSEQTEPQGSPRASNQKVWQKNKKKGGKKAKPNKQQAKKKPVKQQAKKKTTQEDNEKKNNDEEEEKKQGNDQDEEIESESEKVEPDEEEEGEGEEGEEVDEKPADDRDPVGANNAANESDSLSDTNGSSDDDSENLGKKDAVETEDEEEWEKLQTNSRQRDKVLDNKSKESHTVHAPYFPEDKQEWWWIYITDRRRTKLVASPQQIFSLKDEEEIELKFQAPERPHTYNYTVTLRSDAYMDCDVHQNFKVDVHEAKEVEIKQWDFESDEDKDDEESGESEYEEDVSDSD